MVKNKYSIVPQYHIQKFLTGNLMPSIDLQIEEDL